MQLNAGLLALALAGFTATLTFAHPHKHRLARKDTGLDRDFPNGEIDCSHFPAEYGALALPWVTKDGWSGIQKDGGNDDGRGVCTDDALCSYACPAGYSKAQWPADQPASGESHGGLKCRGGKLYRTRDGYTKLCQPGQGTAQVRNKLDKFVAICRTDYPGQSPSQRPVLLVVTLFAKGQS